MPVLLLQPPACRTTALLAAHTHTTYHPPAGFLPTLCAHLRSFLLPYIPPPASMTTCFLPLPHLAMPFLLLPLSACTMASFAHTFFLSLVLTPFCAEKKKVAGLPLGTHLCPPSRSSWDSSETLDSCLLSHTSSSPHHQTPAGGGCGMQIRCVTACGVRATLGRYLGEPVLTRFPTRWYLAPRTRVLTNRYCGDELRARAARLLRRIRLRYLLAGISAARTLNRLPHTPEGRRHLLVPTTMYWLLFTRTCCTCWQRRRTALTAGGHHLHWLPCVFI